MSNFLRQAHMCTALIGVLSVAVTEPRQPLRLALPTPTMFEKLILRVNVEFEHGDTKADNPKFGGIYNLIQSAKVQINNSEDHNIQSGVNLYTDSFKRNGRERNSLNYAELPETHTETIHYCFAGSRTVLGGVVVPDGAFALDLRHTKDLGNQTYNDVSLVLDVGVIQDVFADVNDTAIKSLSIEVFGAELFHNELSRKALAVDLKRYAEILPREEIKKVTDTALAQEFILSPLGSENDGVYLSDLIIVQTDENGAPIPFGDENQNVKIMIGDFPICQRPIWQIREDQDGGRVQAVPPNVLILPLAQAASGLGGLSPSELFAGAKLCLSADSVDGQDTVLSVQKTYTTKPV